MGGCRAKSLAQALSIPATLSSPTGVQGCKLSEQTPFTNKNNSSQDIHDWLNCKECRDSFSKNLEKESMVLTCIGEIISKPSYRSFGCQVDSPLEDTLKKTFECSSSRSPESNDKSRTQTSNMSRVIAPQSLRNESKTRTSQKIKGKGKGKARTHMGIKSTADHQYTLQSNWAEKNRHSHCLACSFTPFISKSNRSQSKSIRPTNKTKKGKKNCYHEYKSAQSLRREEQSHHERVPSGKRKPLNQKTYILSPSRKRKATHDSKQRMSSLTSNNDRGISSHLRQNQKSLVRQEKSSLDGWLDTLRALRLEQVIKDRNEGDYFMPHSRHFDSNISAINFHQNIQNRQNSDNLRIQMQEYYENTGTKKLTNVESPECSDSLNPLYDHTQKLARGEFTQQNEQNSSEYDENYSEISWTPSALEEFRLIYGKSIIKSPKSESNISKDFHNMSRVECDVCDECALCRSVSSLLNIRD